ncbi:Ig-like domain-containing protein [Nocardioides sp. AX2bis]|uniref:Ig-like domain-containing protein n=1 Tax=Nocardioides sp. AX2bis TaxID=2653157 RepID=UPI0012F18F94|nr:Ig-like domain-containing protein [Nocardioides sp. AX2bis]VXC22938.1 conserved exported hypothetical protein [Nocardioides sp. AX2bis]
MAARRSPLALLATGALTAAVVPGLGFVAGVAAGPVAAAPPDAVAGTGLLATPDAPPQGRAWLEGLVVDQAGRRLDDVVVQAFDVDDLAADADAEPVSSWLTYADPADGPAHGFYRLYVPQGRTASYEVRLSSPEGAADPYRARTLDDAVVVGGGKKQPGEVKELGTAVMTLERKADATVRLKASRDVSKPGRTARLAVTVTSPDVDPVTGRLLLGVDGRTRGRQPLTRQDDGRAAFTLPALKPGKHTLTVRYAGSDLVRATSGRTAVKVDQPPRKGKGTGRR